MPPATANASDTFPETKTKLISQLKTNINLKGEESKCREN